MTNAKILRLAGIVSVGNITDTDRLGIPLWQVQVRAFSGFESQQRYISCFGKAVRQKEARRGAVMEAIERSNATQGRSVLRTELVSVRDIKAAGRCFLHPKDISISEGTNDVIINYRNDQKIEWVCGKNLTGDGRVLIPAEYVFVPYQAGEHAHALGASFASGLGCAFSRGAAIVHGLLELVERHNAEVAYVLDKPTLVDFSQTRSKPLLWLLKCFRRAGINITVKDVTHKIGIPTFIAASDDPHTHNPYLLCGGQAAHWDAETAMIGAITEVAQSRMAVIWGGKSGGHDPRKYTKKNYHRLKSQMGLWFDESDPKRDANQYRKKKISSVRAATRHVVSELGAAGFKKIYWVDLTNRELKIPVVKCIIPGMMYDMV